MSEATFEAKFDDGSYCIGTLEYVRQKVSEKYKAGVLMDHFGQVEESEPAKAEGLVAPKWSDAGPVPVGEVTYLGVDLARGVDMTGVAKMNGHVVVNITAPRIEGDYERIASLFRSISGRGDGYRFKDWPGGVIVRETSSVKFPDPNAKPSLPALGKVAGEEYRGLGWCDE